MSILCRQVFPGTQAWGGHACGWHGKTSTPRRPCAFTVGWGFSLRRGSRSHRPSAKQGASCNVVAVEITTCGPPSSPAQTRQTIVRRAEPMTGALKSSIDAAKRTCGTKHDGSTSKAWPARRLPNSLGSKWRACATGHAHWAKQGAHVRCGLGNGWRRGARDPRCAPLAAERAPSGLQLYCNRYCNRGGTALYIMVPTEHHKCRNANNGALCGTP